MIVSMTGYGSISIQKSGISVAVEIRTANHRFLDLHVRLAREYSFLEPEICQLVREALRRGRVDASIIVQAPPAAEFLINIGTARSYFEAAARLQDEFHFEGALDLKTLLLLPGVLQNQAPFSSPEGGPGADLRECVLAAVRQAIDAAVQMRRQEGRTMESEMRAYINCIRERVGAIRTHLPAALDEYRQRLEERLKYLLPQITPDPQRLAQEVALVAEKSDVSEELSRLESHLDQYSGVLDQSYEAGKKMDFLLQEMHREVNTMLSKTGHLEVTKLGIALKADIEKLREQAQNVE